MNTTRISGAIALSFLASACLGDAGPSDPSEPPECAAPLSACGADCVDLESDPASCGECDRACGASEYCSAGECVGGCADGWTACGRSCLDLAQNAAHCGACEAPCAEGFDCVEGVCVAEEGTGGGATSDRRIRVSGSAFTVCGRPIFMNGANTPWHSWDDFGGGYDATWWNDHFSDLHQVGVNSSRVWITCSGSVGIDIDADGAVLGATPDHWEHLDSFFSMAEAQEIYVMATLMSFDHFEDGASARWRAWIASDESIDSYVENYLIPFLERYGENPYLWSIDLMNEPDWVYERENVSFDRLNAYFARAARAIHDRSEVLVTIGMGGPKYSAGCVGCERKIADARLREAVDDPSVYLDFYSPHYYDWIGNQWGNTMYMSPGSSNFPMDRPLLFGEHPARGTLGHALVEDLEAAFSHGWRGTMPWTSNGVDRNGGFTEVSAAAGAFRDARPWLVFPVCP